MFLLDDITKGTLADTPKVLSYGGTIPRQIIIISNAGFALVFLLVAL